MSMLRFPLILLLGLLLSGGPTYVWADTVAVPQTTDLQRDGRLALERNLPLLILFSRHGCGYCDVVRESFLEPMLKSGHYQDKVIMRMLRLEHNGVVRDFDGSASSAQDLARRYQAGFTPTVIFVDGHGQELTPRLRGLTTIDFYGGYLDDAIHDALARLRPLAMRQE